MGIVIRVLINAAALWVAIAILDGINLEGDSFAALLGIAIVLGVVNVIVRPILLLLSLPLIIVTLGIFLLIVNTIAMWLVIVISDALGFGLSSAGFGWTFAAAVVVSIVSWVLEAFTRSR
ncbi:MAG: phage holin family protein [Nitriliruptoraceae bacterium]